MASKKILRMGAQKTPLQKSYEISTGTDSLNVEFLGSNRQFDWLEILIVPGKSDKQSTIYDSYNRELIDNLTQRRLLYKQFVTRNCSCSSVAPLTDYMNNPIFQELSDEDTYFSVKNDERVYLDPRASSGYVKETEKL